MKAMFQATIIAITVLFASVTFGQNTVATVKSAQELIDLKKTGVCVINLPGEYTKAEIADRAKYYTTYFTVDYNEKTKGVTIKMVENEARSRQVIERFMVACGIEKLQIGDELVATSEIFSRYLNN